MVRDGGKGGTGGSPGPPPPILKKKKKKLAGEKRKKKTIFALFGPPPIEEEEGWSLLMANSGSVPNYGILFFFFLYSFAPLILLIPRSATGHEHRATELVFLDSAYDSFGSEALLGLFVLCT
jgi:hypothetical protein